MASISVGNLVYRNGNEPPLVGEILTPASWSGVPLHVLIFLTAAVAIGRVGGATGMNAWIAQTVLPGTVPSDPYILAAFIQLFQLLYICFWAALSQLWVSLSQL